MNEEIKKILEIATRAISPYNSQPWRFKIEQNKIQIYIIRTKNFFLKLQGIHHMTLGFLLQNLYEALNHYGYTYKYEFHDIPLGSDAPCATITISKSSKIKKKPIDGLMHRITNRNNYDGKPISDKARTLISKKYDNITIQYSEKTELKELTNALSTLEEIRFKNFFLYREMLHYIRFTPLDNLKNKDFLDSRLLDLKKNKLFLMRILKNRNVHNLLTLLGIMKIVKKRQHKKLSTSSGIITFIIDKKENKNFVNLGIAIQDMLNRLEEINISSMSELSALYILDVLNSNPETFSNKELQKIALGTEKLERFFKTKEEQIVYMIRIGHGKRPTLMSYRKNIEDLILKDE